ncbi:hypothetical protein BAE42_14910 [Mesorhizobium loti]|nr:hypothetical protein BAE42_14910 [Mesorhizobium loti]
MYGGSLSHGDNVAGRLFAGLKGRGGVRFPIGVDRRIKGAGDVGEHKTSMLQDLERGRPMEIDALVSAVQELGRLADKPTPTIDAVAALVRRLAVERGCYG